MQPMNGPMSRNGFNCLVKQCAKRFCNQPTNKQKVSIEEIFGILGGIFGAGFGIKAGVETENNLNGRVFVGSLFGILGGSVGFFSCLVIPQVLPVAITASVYSLYKEKQSANRR